MHIGGHTQDFLLHGQESAHKNGIVKTFTHTDIPIHPCTLLKKEKEKQRAKPSTHQTWRLPLVVLSCPMWWWATAGKLDTFTHTGPRHLSPRSRVCAQEWHRKDIHSHSHSHPPMHTTKTKSKTLNSPNMTPSFSCPLMSNVVLADGHEAWQILLRTAPRRRPFRLRQYRQKTFLDVFSTYCNISRQQWPF